jgi:ATP-binding cassette subfamily C exporter for protease/lipase
VRQYFTGQGIFGFMDLPWVPIYIAVMSLLHPALGLAALCFAALQAGVAWWGHRVAVAPAEAAAQAQREEHEFVRAKIRNLDALHAMGMAGPLQAVWQRLHGHCVDQQAFAQSQSHRLVAISKFLRYVQQSCALAVGAWLVIRGELSPGAMVAANVLMSRALAPIDMMVSTWKGFVMSREAMRRLASLLNANPPGSVDNTSRAPVSPDIAFEGVSVSVPGRADPILRGLSGRFSPGTITVIMGPSGSGKSTLLRCVLGLQPFQGSLTIAGHAPGALGPGAQGRLVGYLSQELGLFEATVAENIARLGAVDSALVIKAAKATGLHETILRLPQGYDTAITDAPGMLSGGQRQRLALARAVYGQPSILLLDEPNSNLDQEGEQGLNQTLDQARRQGCTVVVVSHRPSILSMADQLILLVDGRIVKAGPPAHIVQSLVSAQPAVAST